MTHPPDRIEGADKPVWIWLPDASEPVRCGTLSLRAGTGRFTYDDGYLERPDRVALDPLHLPAVPGRPAAATGRRGLTGVFLDALPCGFTRAILEARHGLCLAEAPLALLDLADGDGFGALAVCDQIGRKAAHAPPEAEELLRLLERLPPAEPCGRAIAILKDAPKADLGRRRPLTTVRHRGEDWLVKLQDPAGEPHSALREFLAMRAARAAGLDVAPVEFFRPGGREVLLVRRFDRHQDGQGRRFRRLYASAHTVLGLGRRAGGDERARHSYLALGREFERFAGVRGNAAAFRRELWRRMAFNVVCGNGDDHTDNHGLIFRDGNWRLAPAFDIAPCAGYRGVQALALNAEESCVGSRATLLSDCAAFGWPRRAAAQFIEQAEDALAESWPAELARAGFPPDTIPPPDPRLWLDDLSPSPHRHPATRM